MYEHVRSGTTGQPLRAPRVPPVATFKRSGGHKNVPPIAISDGRVVRGEDSAGQGTVSYHSTCSDHHMGPDASSKALGGLIRRHFGTVCLFRAATGFAAERYNTHINVKETFALHGVLKLATTTQVVSTGAPRSTTRTIKRCTTPVRKSVHGTHEPTTLSRSSSGIK